MMAKPTIHLQVFSLAAVLVCSAGLTFAQGPNRQRVDQEHWVPTWGTAQLLLRVAPQGRGAPPTQPPATQQPNPIPQPNATQPTPPVPGGVQTLNNQTVRMIVRTSIGGRRARLKLSNAFGGLAVTIGAAHVAKRSEGAGIVPDSDRALTFAGKTSVRMAPGAVVISDPVMLDISPLTDLAVSLYLPEDTGPPTTHSAALRTTYVSTEGDFTAAPEIREPRTTTSYYWLSSIEVTAPANTAAVVTFGDSITDGARSTVDTHNTWPALLAARLAANKATANIAVVNQGIGGNRVLTDAAGLAGVNALARLDRDVLSQPGVKWLMVLEGINDIGALAQPNAVFRVTADDLIGAYQQIITRAHAHDIRVIGCTLTPYGGAGYYTEQGEAIRDAVNQWIRTSKAFDAVVDFEAATRDPADGDKFRPEFDPGDHLHPNDAGYKAMAEAVNLAIFK
jgi:lysophospholipase L1-like esterase